MIETSLLRTAKGNRAIPLRGVKVSGEVVGGHGVFRVQQTYVNEEKKPVEAVYVFPLPSDATLTGFSMRCAGRNIAGVVKEREEAFREYDEALTRGHGAALLDQERANVFTAQVGNLLPGEETLVEVEYVQRLHADEGALRVCIPTLVAPRYIPGRQKGDRTASGWADPTDQVPDADRITPPPGIVDYGLTLDLTLSLGTALEVTSPSHAVQVTSVEGGTRVRFAQPRTWPSTATWSSTCAASRAARSPPSRRDRQDGATGTFAFTLVPDLFDGRPARPLDVVFVVDTSGSMGGASIVEARAALRLCLRQLRAGDRFSLIAFDTGMRTFRPEPSPFTQASLEEADAWVAALEADGGTEMLAPLERAVELAGDGVVVLLTDGQVGNEEEILARVLARRKACRVYSFGIGTSVSDALLTDLARRTGGAVECHPPRRADRRQGGRPVRAGRGGPGGRREGASLRPGGPGPRPGRPPGPRGRRAVGALRALREAGPGSTRDPRHAGRPAVPPRDPPRPARRLPPAPRREALGRGADPRPPGRPPRRPPGRGDEAAHHGAGDRAADRESVHVIRGGGGAGGRAARDGAARDAGRPGEPARRLGDVPGGGARLARGDDRRHGRARVRGRPPGAGARWGRRVLVGPGPRPEEVPLPPRPLLRGRPLRDAGLSPAGRPLRIAGGRRARGRHSLTRPVHRALLPPARLRPLVRRGGRR